MEEQEFYKDEFIDFVWLQPSAIHKGTFNHRTLRFWMTNGKIPTRCWLEIDGVKFKPFECESAEQFINRIAVPLYNAMVNNALENI